MNIAIITPKIKQSLHSIIEENKSNFKLLITTDEKSDINLFNIPSKCLLYKNFVTRAKYELAMIKYLIEYDIDLVIIYHYNQEIGTVLNVTMEGKILNSHQSLLPLFICNDPIQKALSANIKYTGITIYFQNNEDISKYIIAQLPIEINEDNNSYSKLQAIILDKEIELYKKVITGVITNKIIYDKKVKISKDFQIAEKEDTSLTFFNMVN